MPEAIRWIERAVLIPLSMLVIVRVAPQLPQNPALIVFLLSELVAVAMILLQRRGEWAVEFFPVAIALIGTSAALLVNPVGVRVAPAPLTSAVILAGAMVSLSAKVFLGRSFGMVAANRGVKDTGIYRLMRHPMYAGYVMSHCGFLLAYFSLGNVLVYAVVWTALGLRIREEEKFLNRDPAYRDYAAKVRYRLFPGIA